MAKRLKRYNGTSWEDVVSVKNITVQNSGINLGYPFKYTIEVPEDNYEYWDAGWGGDFLQDEVSVDWGDGSAIESFIAVNDEYPNHIYSSMGVYQITIYVGDNSNYFTSFDRNYDVISVDTPAPPLVYRNYTGEVKTKLDAWISSGNFNFDSYPYIVYCEGINSGTTYHYLFAFSELRTWTETYLDTLWVGMKSTKNSNYAVYITDNSSTSWTDFSTISATYTLDESIVYFDEGITKWDEVVIPVQDSNGMFSSCEKLEYVCPNYFINNKELMTTDFNKIFSGCTSLTTTPLNIFDIEPNLYAKSKLKNSEYNWRFSSAFEWCERLVVVRDNLFPMNNYSSSEIAVFYGVFYGCSSLINMGDIFPHNKDLNTTNLWSLCRDCTRLEYVPDGFLGGFSSINEDNTFYGCTSLSNLPARYYENYNGASENFVTESVFENTNITSISKEFFTGLNTISTSLDRITSIFSFSPITSIPIDLFDNIDVSNIANIDSLFYGCANLTAIPTDLFANFSSLTNAYGLFRYCTSLTSLPTSLFNSSTSVDSRYLFANCPNVTTFPSGLFATYSPTNMYRCFYNDNGITSAVDDLWNTLTGLSGTQTDDCFYGCVNASNYASIPIGWR